MITVPLFEEQTDSKKSKPFPVRYLERQDQPSKLHHPPWITHNSTITWLSLRKDMKAHGTFNRQQSVSSLRPMFGCEASADVTSTTSLRQDIRETATCKRGTMLKMMTNSSVYDARYIKSSDTTSPSPWPLRIRRARLSCHELLTVDVSEIIDKDARTR